MCCKFALRLVVYSSFVSGAKSPKQRKCVFTPLAQGGATGGRWHSSHEMPRVNRSKRKITALGQHDAWACPPLLPASTLQWSRRMPHSISRTLALLMALAMAGPGTVWGQDDDYLEGDVPEWLEGYGYEDTHDNVPVSEGASEQLTEAAAARLSLRCLQLLTLPRPTDGRLVRLPIVPAGERNRVSWKSDSVLLRCWGGVNPPVAPPFAALGIAGGDTFEYTGNSRQCRDDLACDGLTIVFVDSSTPRIPPIHCLGLFNGIQEDCQPPLAFLGFHTLPSRRQRSTNTPVSRVFTNEAPCGLPRWDNQRAGFPEGQTDHNRGLACGVVIATDAGSRLTLRASGRSHRSVEAEPACARRCHRRG